MSSITLEIAITREAQGAGRYAATATILSLGAQRQRLPLVPNPVPLGLDPDALRGLTLSPDEYSAALTTMVFEPRLLKALGYALGYQQRDGAPVALRIALDPDAAELHALRWELLREPPDGFLFATSGAIIFARTLFAQQITAENLVRGGHRALVAVADPPARPLPRDPFVDYVALARQSLGEMHLTVLDGRAPNRPATFSAIDAALAEGPEILYLVCHGAVADGEPYLYLEHEGAGEYRPTRGLRLVEAVAQQRRPLLAVLLSCDSAGNDYEALTAVGPRLARAGVPAVLAMHGQVAHTFVAAFVPRVLDELRRDGRVDRAVAAARRGLGDATDAWKPILWTSFDNPDIVALGFTPPASGRGGIVRALEAPVVPEAPAHPRVANLPDPPVAPEIARPDDLRALAGAFVAAIDAGQPPAVVVTGAPGLGKTALLREFARRYGSLFGGGVYWVSCQEGALLEEELLACAQAGLLAPEAVAQHDVPALMGLVREALRAPAQRLLIFDACERPDLLKEFLPSEGGCFLLASARSYDPAVAPGLREHHLGPMGEGLGVSLLRAYKDSLADIEARAFVASLGGSPLALHLAGTFLAHHPRVSPWEVLGRIGSASGAARPAGTRVMPEGRLIELLVHHAMDVLQGGDEDDQLAYELLRHAAAFAPGWDIGRARLLEIVGRARGAEEAARLPAALARLLGYGLLFEVRAGGEAEAPLRAHPAIAGSLAQRSDHAPFAEAVAAYLARMCSSLLAQQGAVPFAFERVRGYLPHVRYHAEQTGRLDELLLADLHTILAAYYRLLGTQGYGERAIRLAFDLHNKSLRTVAQQVVQGYREAAEFAKLVGDTRREIEHLERARQIVDTVAAESYAERANIAYLLAIRKLNIMEQTAAQDENGERLRKNVREEAIKLLVQAEQLIIDAGGFGTEVHANVLHERGVVSFAMGDVEKSRSDLRDALTNRTNLWRRDKVERTSADLDPRDAALLTPIAATLYNLGGVEMRGDNLERARGHLERALEIRHAVRSGYDDQTIAVITSLVLCLNLLGDHAAVEELKEREIRRAREQQPPNPVQVRNLETILDDLT